MTRSADDETLRVPAGCPKRPVHRPCLRRTPGRDSTLERRSPEVKKAEARFDRILPLVHLLASARPVPSGLRFPGTTLRRAEQLRCHATTHAMPTRMSASKRSATRHLAFCGSEDRGFRSGWSPRRPFRNRNRGPLGFHDAILSRRRGGSSQTASVFLHHPRAPPCFTAQPSQSPHRPWQVRSELGKASGSEGFSLVADRRSPDRLLP
jgi:hypothetical protein